MTATSSDRSVSGEAILRCG